MRLKKLVIAFVVFFFATLSFAQQKYKYKVVVKDLRSPWGFTFLPDNSILITEKSGTLIHFKNGVKTEVSGVPKTEAYGQGGLMDVELHPNFKENNYIYFSYIASHGYGKGYNTAIMRAKLKNNKLVDQEILYKASPNTRRSVHFGSRIAFDKDGYLYFSIGDRGNRDENPQDITKDCGKVYRINDDGTIPKDNPFVSTENAKKAIYSYGHRNPQGMEINPFTQEIWTHEHGPKGGDEINIIEKGINYGWPKASFGRNYSGTKFTNNTSLSGMKDPLHHWTPSIAPSGMAFVSSKKYPKLYGNVLVGSLKFQYLASCTLKNGKVIKEEKLLEDIGRVRSVEQGKDGYIYVGVEDLGIIKLLPSR